VSERPAQQNLILILARAFASRLATAVFFVDADGTVVYYNEAAERLLGTKFVEGRGMGADDWSTRFSAADHAGTPMPLEDMPLGVAIQQRRPHHETLRIRDGEGRTRRIEVTAFPLLAHAGELVGALAIFWEAPATSGAHPAP
jgi:PAS domain-containing protein